jgi:hypothetical protein
VVSWSRVFPTRDDAVLWSIVFTISRRLCEADGFIADHEGGTFHLLLLCGGDLNLNTYPRLRPLFLSFSVHLGQHELRIADDSVVRSRRPV